MRSLYLRLKQQESSVDPSDFHSVEKHPPIKVKRKNNDEHRSSNSTDFHSAEMHLPIQSKHKSKAASNGQHSPGSSSFHSTKTDFSKSRKSSNSTSFHSTEGFSSPNETSGKSQTISGVCSSKPQEEYYSYNFSSVDIGKTVDTSQTASASDNPIYDRTRLKSLLATKKGNPENIRRDAVRYSREIIEPRVQWAQSIDFRYVVLGFLVGTGDFVRFPNLLNKYGGFTFIFVYILLYIVFAYPVIFMEYGWGQFCSRGPGACWDFAKLFQGVGYAMFFLDWIYMVSYSTKGVWMVYLMSLLRFHWIEPLNDGTDLYNKMIETLNRTDERLTTFGKIQWPLVFSYLFIWVFVCLFLLYGISVMGRVASYVVPSNAFVCFVLIIKGLTLPGAIDGVCHPFTLGFTTHLFNIHMWVDAGQQLFFSMALTLGVHLTFSSYNHFNNQATHDALSNSLFDILASLIGIGFSFSYLGFLSGGDNDVLSSYADFTENKMLFETLPTALSKVSLPELWLSLFFIFFVVMILFNLSFMTEIIITGVMDSLELRDDRRKYIILAVCFLTFLTSMACLSSEKNLEISNLLIYYSDTFLHSAVSIIQVMSIAWVYGVNRFICQVECTVGWETSPVLSLPIMKKWWAACWKFITPTVLFAVGVVELINFVLSEKSYARWASIVGNSIIILVIALIILPMCVFIYNAEQKSIYDRLIYLTTPLTTWGPQYPQHRRIVEMGEEIARIEAEEMRKRIPVATTYEELEHFEFKPKGKRKMTNFFKKI